VYIGEEVRDGHQTGGGGTESESAGIDRGVEEDRLESSEMGVKKMTSIITGEESPLI